MTIYLHKQDSSNRVVNFWICAILFAISTLVAEPSHAQLTAPAGFGHDSNHHKNLQVLRMAPMARRASDNAVIDSAKQFGGAKDVSNKALALQTNVLENIRLLTFAGENGSANLNPNGMSICFEARSIRPKETTCDQTYMMSFPDGKHVRRISTGYGKTNSACFLPSGDEIIYASTHNRYLGQCPPVPESTPALWSIGGGYDLYLADTNGRLLRRLTNTDSVYNGDASVSAVSHRILFTSSRAGDVNLYSIKLDGSDIRQLTSEPGYDGNACYSSDGAAIVYCASHPSGDARASYDSLLSLGLVQTNGLQIYTMNPDGSHQTQVTKLAGANIYPSWSPDGKWIIFSSNSADAPAEQYSLYRIHPDGSGLERLTHGLNLTGPATFTANGKQLLFSATTSASGDKSNIFVADWNP